jgi:hypothetical protein
MASCPYYWSSENNAQYLSYGASILAKTSHDGKQLNFNYGAPTKNECTSCHTISPALQGTDDLRAPIFKPIGPKARYRNWEVYCGNGEVKNQLDKWEEVGILIGVPTDNNTIYTAAVFDDSVNIQTLTSD